MNNIKSNRIKWSHASISLLIIVGSVFIFREPLYNQLYSWDLIPKPETYTELYFANTPPELFTPGQQHTLAFTIHNVEYQTTSYAYTIDQLNSNGHTLTTLAKGSVSLAQDAQKTLNIPVTLTGDASVSTVRVTISFLEKDKSNTTTESIYYLVKEEKI